MSNIGSLGFDNLSMSDNLFGIYSLLKNKVMWFNYYRKTYRNFLNVIQNDQNENYPFEATLRNGKNVSITSRDKAGLYALLSVYNKIKYNEVDDSISFKYSTLGNEKTIKLFGITQNLDAILVFSNDATYESLPIKNKIIFDVGACTGDTAIYFANKDAKKVIAVEPFPKNFELAAKNVKENNLDSIIHVMLGGCGGSSKTILVDPSYQSSMRSTLQESINGTTIPIFTLEQILDKFTVTEAVLKMDCEGCEYETILNTPKDVLRRFSHIQIEYHNGFKNIKNHLENCGFFVRNIIVDNSKRGHIFAARN